HSIWKREHHRNSFARQLVECGVKVVRHASLQSYQLDPHRSRRSLHVRSLRVMRWIAGVHQQTNLARVRNHFARKCELFARQIFYRQQHAGHVASRPGMTAYKAKADRIDQYRRDYRDRVRELLEGNPPSHRARHEHLGLDTNQLFRKRLRSGLITIGVTDLEGPVLTFDVSEVSHPLHESIKNTLSARLGASNQTADHGTCQSLSESRERPCGRAAEQRDELAPPDVEHGGFLRPPGSAAASIIPAIARPAQCSAARSACRRATGRS